MRKADASQAPAFRRSHNEELSGSGGDAISRALHFLLRVGSANHGAKPTSGSGTQNGGRGAFHFRRLFYLPACRRFVTKTAGSTTDRWGGGHSLGRTRGLLESPGLERSLFVAGVDAAAAGVFGILQDTSIYATDGCGWGEAVCREQRIGCRS